MGQEAQEGPVVAVQATANGAAQAPPRFVHHRRRSSLGVPAEPPPSWHAVVGVALLVALVALCAGAPTLLCPAFLLFAAIALPWRVVDFWQRGFVFFLVDFCYVSALWGACARRLQPAAARTVVMLPHKAQFANVAVVALLLLEPAPGHSARSAWWWEGLNAATYMLAEGPLAAALIAWRCAWVLDAPDKTIRCPPGWPTCPPASCRADATLP